MPKAAAFAAAAVAAAAALALFIKHRRSYPAPSAPSSTLPPTAPRSTSHPQSKPVALASDDAAASERVVDYLPSFNRLKSRLQEIKQQQQSSTTPLVAQAAAQWSTDADACAAEWRAAKAEGHSSAARALADMHASDEMCLKWRGGAEGWALQTSRDCEGGRVRDDVIAAQTYV